MLLGAVCTATLRWALPSPTLHLVFISLATTSILVGALQLISSGLSLSVMLGIALVWLVLFIGDLVAESDEEAAGTSLERSSHKSFKRTVHKQKATAEWRKLRTLKDLAMPIKK